MSMFFIVVLTLALVLVSMFIVMIILMQRPNEETGLGATLGEGSVTAVFGGDAVNVLARWTKWCVGFFYLAAFLLAMIYMAREHKPGKADEIIPKKMAVTEVADDTKATTVEENSLGKSAETGEPGTDSNDAKEDLYSYSAGDSEPVSEPITAEGDNFLGELGEYYDDSGFSDSEDTYDDSFDNEGE
ncbi:MAG: preprotein translocase subunit SecG [Puniceicoccales bacterium]|jgi:protein translocase SecG subunit|nr:preprotein translocase subunit SecG [Puniceicoccales bacterium]